MANRNFRNVFSLPADNRATIALERFESRLFLSTYVVNTLSDAVNPGSGLLSLRQAVADANAHHGANAITFDPKVFTPGSLHTVELTQGEIEFNNTSGMTTVDGPGDSVLAVNGDQNSRVFEIASGASVSITGLTITGGSVNTAAGVLGTGGGVENAGTLALTEVTVADNSATGGDQTSFNENGGAAEGGGIGNTGALSLTDCVISGNTADGGSSAARNTAGGNGSGGGIYSSGSLMIVGSTISGNTAKGGAIASTYYGSAGDADGGGICVAGEFSLNSTTLSGNAALGGGSGNGNVIGGPGAGQDATGGMAAGGAIYASGSSAITNGILTGNEALSGNSGVFAGGALAAFGGAIFSLNSLTVRSSKLADNQAVGGLGPTDDNGPGSNAYGGGIAAESTLTLSNSTISTNLAKGGSGGAERSYQESSGYGGGIYATKSLTITGSTISGNTTEGGAGERYYGGEGGNGEGGGVFTSGTASIAATSIIGNSVVGGSGDTNDGVAGNGGPGEGGGIFNGGALTLTNSTLASNQAGGGAGGADADNNLQTAGGNGGDGIGGAIHSGGALTLNDTTISGNTAVGGPGGVGNVGYPNGATGAAEGGGIYAGKNSVLNNSILSANNAASGADVYSSLSTKSANNLIGYGGGLTNGVNGNKIGIHNPMLTPLGNYGGPTETMVPLPGSPAIGGGNASLLPAGVTTDQRGYPRTTNHVLDIGATQFGDAAITGLVFNDEYATGKRQAGDPALAGFTVYLDLNRDGQFDSGDISSVTNSSGIYAFADVPAGVYPVDIAAQRTWRLTSPAASPVYVSVTPSQTTIAGPTFAETQDALLSGIVINSRTDKPLSGFRVYVDLNDDGKWESTEPSVVTASGGAWSFNIPSPGTYRVSIVSNKGYKTISPSGGVFTFVVGKASARIGNVFSEELVS